MYLPTAGVKWAIMTGFITGIEPNPNFPIDDISENNVSILAVLLRSPEVLRGFHYTAEQQVRMYRLGHSAIRRGIETLFQPEQVRAASVGVAVYEALSALVQPKPPVIDETGITYLGVYPEQTAYELFQYYDDATAIFCRQMPGTAEVIREAAAPLVNHDVHYAVLGAAAARHLELETV